MDPRENLYKYCREFLVVQDPICKGTFVMKRDLCLFFSSLKPKKGFLFIFAILY